MMIDGGLAAERTELAWRRNGISVIAAGLAITRGLPHERGWPGRPAIGILIAGIGGLLFIASRSQAVRRANFPGLHRPRARPGDLVPVMVATVALSCAALAVTLMS